MQDGLVFCACGSGLRGVRCCELQEAMQSDPVNYTMLASQMEQIRGLRVAGKNREALRRLLNLLDVAPLYVEALECLFDIRQVEGNRKAALVMLKRIVLLRPESKNALSKYAELLLAEKDYTQAIEMARRGLLLAPESALLNHILGLCYTELGRLQVGERHYHQALALDPSSKPQVEINLAWNLRQQGRLEEASSLYMRLRAEGRATTRMLTSFAQVEAGRGKVEDAAQLLDAALQATPNDRVAALLQAILQLRQGVPAAALECIAATEAALAPNPLMATELILRGQAFERLGKYHKAFESYQAGRAFQREQANCLFNPAPIQARLRALQETFKAERLVALPRPATCLAGPQPIFLLGTPRSGTSLLEHLLTQSLVVDPADQHAPWSSLAALVPSLVKGLDGTDLPFPEALTATICGESYEIPALLSARYLRTLKEAGVTKAGTKFVTDRHADLPWLLGFAALLFPEAPVIHVLRHPLDVVLSSFAQDSLYEGNAGVTLNSSAQLYDHQMHAISHIRAQMTLRYLPVRYENLVEKPKETLQKVHRFIGLTEANSQAMVETPWRALPRVPAYRAEMEQLHKFGLNRHRNFENIFAEVMPLLSPWIERLGYVAPKGSAA